MEWLERLAGETRSRILELVREGPRSVSELAASLGISSNAVRTHVAALERDGLVAAAGTRRSTGGKPARLYGLSREAEELFPKAYVLAFTELLATLREEDGEPRVAALLREVGRRLGSPARSAAAAAAAGEAPEAGARRAAGVLESIGGSVEVRRAGEDWVIEAAGCPLSGVVAGSPEVCGLAQSLVSEAAGRPVEERCDRTGRPQCAFVVEGEGRRPVEENVE